MRGAEIFWISFAVVLCLVLGWTIGDSIDPPPPRLVTFGAAP